MPRLMFVITGLGRGGAEQQMVQLAIAMAHKSYKVHVVSMIHPEYFLADLAAHGIEVSSLNMPKGVPELRGLMKFIELVKSWRPAILHSHMVHANLLVRMTRLFCSVPVVVCTAHSINEGSRWREIAYRLTDPLADITTNVSMAAVDRYIKVGAVPARKICYVPNGVNTAKYMADEGVGKRIRIDLGLSENSFVWLAVGRFEAAKDYPSLMCAFHIVLQKYSSARLLIAGQGSMVEATKKLAADLGIGQAVRFLGLRDDVPGLMSAANAYVMSSAWEGLPMVLLEAASCGLPIVATDVGGNREVVRHGVNGYTVPVRDVGALAEAMHRMMELPLPQIVAMGVASRMHAIGAYCLQNIVTHWDALYASLLNQKCHQTESA